MTSKLTIEQAKRLRNDFECWQQDYDPKNDKEQYDMFGRGMIAMDMLIAGMYQEPVAYAVSNDFWNQGNHKQHIDGKQCDLFFPGDVSHGEKFEPDDYDYVFPLYRHAQPAQTGVDDDVRNIIGLLETNEWAEHCTETVLGSRLESEITRLVGRAQSAPVVPEIDRKAIADKVYGKCCRIPGATFYNAAEFAIDEVEACRTAMLQAGNSPVIPGWIPVSERMPEERETVVLVADERGIVWCAEIQDGEIYPDEFPGTRGFGCSEATHWMPLPAAPQEVK